MSDLWLEINSEIAKLPSDDQIQVRAIATTLRNIIDSDPAHALLALALVGAEAEEQCMELVKHGRDS